MKNHALGGGQYPLEYLVKPFLSLRSSRTISATGGLAMRPRTGFILALSVALSAVPAFSDDQQKAEKQIRKISAMATDVTARGIVSRSMSDMLKIDRDQLQRERRAMNLNYGCLFIAHELTARGMKMLDVAMRLQ